jgi:hypothetical protein
MISTSTISLRPLPWFALLDLVIQITSDFVMAQPTLETRALVRIGQPIRPDGHLWLSVCICVFAFFGTSAKLATTRTYLAKVRENTDTHGYPQMNTDYFVGHIPGWCALDISGSS